MYLAKWFIAPAIHLFINRYSQGTSHHSPWIYFELKLLLKLHEEASEPSMHCVLFLFTPWFPLVSITLTVTNTFSSCLVDVRFGRTDLGTYRVALRSCSSVHSGRLMPLLCLISVSSSDSQLSSLSLGSAKSPFQFSPLLVSEILSGAPCLSLLTGCGFILRIRRIFNIWVHPWGKSFADNAGGKGELSHNFQAAAPWCWKSNQEACTIYSLSEMYPTAVIWLSWAQDSFSVTRRFWLPCHISRQS